MSGTEIFVAGLVVAALLAVTGVVTVAGRRGPAPTNALGRFDKRAANRDRQRIIAAVAPVVAEVEVT